MTNTSAGPDATASDSAGVAIAAWFGERLPSEWTAIAPQVTVDREEIIVILTIPAPESAGSTPPEPGSPEADAEADATTKESASDDAQAAAAAQALAGRIARFREETRD